jgi:outer membrane receptor protein involved in Fe transport
VKTSLTRVSILTLATVLALPAQAQDTAQPATVQAQPEPAPAEDYEPEAGGEIVVTATRQRGTVDTDVPPVVELDEEEIAAVGAGSLEDLIAQLAPQTGSGRGRGGRPVFLVNGQRVSGFREFRRYPPEAIQSVQVFPEEVALQYGYPADQRVINFILKDNFASREIEAEIGVPTAGGRYEGEAEYSQLTINGPNRLSLGAEYNRSTLLTEDERDIIQTEGSVPTVAGDPDPAAFRSLSGSGDTVELEATWNTGFGEGRDAATFSINGNLTHETSLSLSGLDTVLLTDGGDSALRTLDDDPLERRRRSTTGAIASSFNKPLGDWNLSATVDASHGRTVNLIDVRRDGQVLQDLVDAGDLEIDGVLPAVPSAGVDRSVTNLTNATSLVTLRGNPILLPSGEVSVTFDSGYTWDRIASTDTRANVGETVLKRGDLTAGVNVGVPLASAREGFLEPLGELNLNLGAGINHLSDFGTLTDWTAGLNWRPTDRLSLQGSYTVREAAPGLAQLGDPQIVTVNVPVFDFTRGETALVDVTAGGNPNLLAETQRDIKLSAAYELDLFDRADIRVEYFRNRSENVTESFPLLTPEIEAAFPDRVTRDGDGRLVAIDRRAVTFAERNSSRIRYGINLFGRLGSPPPEGANAERGGGRRGGFMGAAMAAAQPAPAPQASGTGAPTGEGQRQGRGGMRGMMGGFDPARLTELRTQLCAEGAGPVDPATLPQEMRDRLAGPDGTIDPARLEQMRQRFCSTDASRFDPARMAAMRQTLCLGFDPNNPSGSPVPDLSALPEEMLARLRGADGQIDQARAAELRNRVCAMPAPAEGGEGRQRGGGEGGGEARGGGGGGGGRGPGGGGFGGRGGGDGQGRWNLSLYHTIELENEALIAAGVPVLDLLDGSALGSGGVSRHRFELEGGMFKDGLGFRLSGNYASGTTVNGSGLPGSSDLTFGDLATFNLRAFADLEQQRWLVGDNPGFFKGARLTLAVNNLFDAQQRVTDETGTVPLSYQPGLIDPLGRTVSLEFRKVF